MNRLIILVLLSTLVSPVDSMAAKWALLVGGGGEKVVEKSKYRQNRICAQSSMDTDPKMESYQQCNNFRPRFEIAKKSLDKNGWKTEVHYDSHHWQKPFPDTKNASAENTIKFLRAALSKKSGLKKGDQLFIGIATHGSAGNHSLSMGKKIMSHKGRKYEVSDSLYVKTLIPYLKKLNKRGIKVAIMDASCYSGRSVDILNGTGACVMSATNPNTVGFSGSGSIWNLMMGFPYPEVNPDIDGDGSYTAAELFKYGRLNSKQSLLGRTSDCKLDNIEDLGKKVHSLAKFMINYSANPYGDEGKALSGETKCSLDTLSDSFRKIVSSLKADLKKQIETEITKLGYKVDDISTLVTTLASEVKELDTALAAYKPIADKVNSLIKVKKAVPTELRSSLYRKIKTATDLKTKIFNLYKPLVHVACSFERSRNNSDKTACEDFVLWEKGAKK